jgi:hypothetical protein
MSTYDVYSLERDYDLGLSSLGFRVGQDALAPRPQRPGVAVDGTLLVLPKLVARPVPDPQVCQPLLTLQ